MPVDPYLIANIASQFSQGRQLGMETARKRAALARQEQVRNLLAQYTMDGPPEARQAQLNALLQMDPQTAAAVQNIQRAQDLARQEAEELARQREIEAAMQQVHEAQFILASDTPALSLRLLDTDGTFVKLLAERGVIDDADGLTDEEARRVAQAALEQAAPLAGLGPADMLGEETAEVRTFNALTAGFTPEERAQAARVATGIASRAGPSRTVEIGGVPTQVAISRNGQVVMIPLSDLGAEMSGRGAVALAEGEGGRGRVLTESGEFKAVPGTEAARREAVEAEDKAARQAQSERRARTALEEIDEALALLDDKTGFPAAGIGTLIAELPFDSKAAQLRTTLDAIRAQVGFDELNRLRQESPTGGALGPVTERELEFLQAVMGSLDQRNPTTLRRSLERLRKAFDLVINKGLPEDVNALNFEQKMEEMEDDELEALLEKYGR